MSTKTYRGTSLEECFNKVKSEMGGDAIILNSRTFQPIFGKFGKTTHEVIATLDEALAVQSNSRPQMESRSSGGGRGIYGYSRGSQSAQQSAQVAERRAPAGTSPKLRMVDLGPARAIEIAEARTAELRDTERRGIEVRGLGEGRRIELRGEENDDPAYGRVAASRDRKTQRDFTPVETAGDSRDERIQRLEAQVLTLSTSFQIIKDAVSARSKAARGATASLPAAAVEPMPTYAPLRKKLIDAGVVEPLARRLVDGLREGLSDTEAVDALRTAIAGRIILAGALDPISGKTRCVAFVGPTGVGKTTTLAKLAAHLTLVDHLKVAIITADTQRVGASRQIETFGEILRVPVKIAYDADELTQHYDDFAAHGYDFVLVDTPGKSPNDSIAIGEVARSLKRLPMLTKYLVVPANLSGPNHDYVTGKFYALASPDAVILTKCDESADTSHFANLLTAQAKFSVPIAYIAGGPRVPDDLTVADPHMMAEKLVGPTPA